MTAATHRDDHQPLSLWIALFTLLLAALWGGTSVTAREAADQVPPLALGAARFGLASLFMVGWCRWERVSLLLRRDEVWPTFVMGLLLFLQIGTFNLGVAWSSASHASLLVNTYIFWVAGTEHFITKATRLRTVQLAGLVIAASGTSLLLMETPRTPVTMTKGGVARVEEPAGRGDSVTPAGERPRDQATLAGDGVLVLSAMLFALKTLYTKRAVKLVPPGTLMLWHDIFGTAMFLIASVLIGEKVDYPWTSQTIFSVLYIGLVVSGFCFAGNAWLLKRHSASAISVFSFATPVFGVTLAIVVRGDRLSGWLLASGLLVATGLVLITTGRGRG